jgi:hypothetical protein
MQHCLSWWLLHTGESGQAEAGQAGASPWPHASTSQLWQVSDILSFVFTILIIWNQHSLCILHQHPLCTASQSVRSLCASIPSSSDLTVHPHSQGITTHSVLSAHSGNCQSQRHLVVSRHFLSCRLLLAHRTAF